MEEQKKTKGSQKRTSVSALIVMGCTFISRILGFVRTAVVSYYFGLSSVADALHFAFALPNGLRKLMAEGALTTAFIPVFSDALKDDPSGRASKRVFRELLGFQFIILIPLSVIVIVFADYIIGGLSSFDNPETVALTVKLFRFMFGYVLLVSFSAIFMAVINSHHSFAIPAITPIIFSICVISSIVIFAPTIGPFSMVLGVLVGGVGQIVFQLPKVFGLSYRPLPILRLSSPYIRRIIKLWAPVAVTSSIFMITSLLATKFASGLGTDGVVASLNTSLIFYQLPFGVFYGAIATVLFPRMSNQVSDDDTKGLKETIMYGLRFLLILLVPSSVLLIMFSNELISVTIQSGQFSLENTQVTATVLIGYSIGLFFSGAFQFFQRIFYAKKNFKIPFAAAMVVLVVDVILSLILKGPYKGLGLALANTGAFFAGFVFLAVMIKVKIGALQVRLFFLDLGKVFLALIPIAVLYFVYRQFTGVWWSEGRTLGNFMITAGLGICSGGILLLMYKVLKVEQINILLRRRKRSN